MTEGNRIVGATRRLYGYQPANYLAIQTTSLSPRLPAHLFQHLIDDAPVNELVQLGQWLSLRPAQLRRAEGFEKGL